MIAPYPLDRELTEDDEWLVAYYQLAKDCFHDALYDGLKIDEAVQHAAKVHRIPSEYLKAYLEHAIFSLEIQRDLTRERERREGPLRRRARAYVDQYVVNGVRSDPLFLVGPNFDKKFGPDERSIARAYATQYAWYLTQFHEIVVNAQNR